MGHHLAVTSESDIGVTFTCSQCQAVCEFMKPGVGEPAAIWSDENKCWLPPDNPETWMGPCIAGEQA